ncbi:MAG TPA: 4-hydroxybenzoate octaprenyltransferase [Limnobacter sp.]|uniref:4-hydroxybenzoate octaprenyltransferase n=1 Tax=Limnobacter sp. TaxID=2003368 RepID=UPI002EDB3EDF
MVALTQARLREYWLLLRLDKPIGILLLMWPTLWGLWMAAEGPPSGYVLFAFVVGVVLMRSAGCAINDYADRDFDRHVERTQHRPLTAGRITPREAVVLAAVLSLVALLITLPLGWATIAMSVPAAFLAGSYPFTKRFFPMPQAYLGLAFSFGIPMAFVAIQGAVPAQAWWVLLANLFWTIAYDTEYAMVDKPDDLKIGIKTSAITFGRFDVLGVMVCYSLFLGIWAMVAFSLGFKPVFWLAWCVALGLVGYHYTLIRNRERALCFKAFLHNNWVGAALFAGLLLNYC